MTQKHKTIMTIMKAPASSWFCEPWCSRADRRWRLGDVQPPLMRSGAPIPSSQKVAAKLSAFLQNIKKWLFSTFDRALHFLHRETNNSPARGRMKTLSPNTCRPSLPQLIYTLPCDMRGIIMQSEERPGSIIWCVTEAWQKHNVMSHFSTLNSLALKQLCDPILTCGWNRGQCPWAPLCSEINEPVQVCFM